MLMAHHLWHRILASSSFLAAARSFATVAGLSRYSNRHLQRASALRAQGSMWDPISQTYADGIVPSHHSVDIDDLLDLNGGKLKIFGYGSLCWHPGSDGVLSLANIADDERDHDIGEGNKEETGKRQVTTAPGRAIGYQRCWSQRSADHRGTPDFNGIVCTLLSDEEVRRLHHPGGDRNGDDGEVKCAEECNERPSMTEGLIYTIDEELAEDCLAELDFREKGGYARDVIDVVEDDTGNTVKALLYRGTPDNPAFWKRALLDPPYAAAVMSVSLGPSGPNDAYLLHLHEFLTHAAQHSRAAALALKDHSGDYRTAELAGMVRALQSEYRPYFLFGAGSNEHGQLLLGSSSEGAAVEGNGLTDVNEVHELTELLLVAPRNDERDGDHVPKSLHAGGGHSALLTQGGDLYLWGWNSAGQLGRAPASEPEGDMGSPLHATPPLPDTKVESADLGHTHTLVIDNEGRLFGFGENGRGQVGGFTDDNEDLWLARTPASLEEERFVDVAAGLFHSAAVTTEGELITWGCGRFGQCLRPDADTQSKSGSTVGRWRPPGGSKLVQVTCGRRHTAALDESGRIWTLGDNKYGQLGRSIDTSSSEPQLVEGQLCQRDSGCVAICSGWSHILATTRDTDSGETTLFGWGRNDKGQLGMKSSDGHICVPEVLRPPLEDTPIQSACCGSESSHIITANGIIYSSGWNEHGNLAIGSIDGVGDECCFGWKTTAGARVVAPPPGKAKRRLFAAGGAHMITLAT
ncbi:hypothetical protein ACHAXT_010491 [Thalassiosira profunda]